MFKLLKLRKPKKYRLLDATQAAIETLEQKGTSQEIAKFLNDERVMGLRGVSLMCPVANYLTRAVREEFGDMHPVFAAMPYSGGGSVLIEIKALGGGFFPPFYREILGFGDLAEFIDDFDAKKYPELDMTARFEKKPVPKYAHFLHSDGKVY